MRHLCEEELAFLRAVRANPLDDLPRLIYADWLDERGDPLGDFIRVQCQVAREYEVYPMLRSAGKKRRSGLGRFCVGNSAIVLPAKDVMSHEDELIVANVEDWVPRPRKRDLKDCHFRRGFPHFDFRAESAEVLRASAQWADRLRPNYFIHLWVWDWAATVPIATLLDEPLCRFVSRITIGAMPEDARRVARAVTKHSICGRLELLVVGGRHLIGQER